MIFFLAILLGVMLWGIWGIVCSKRTLKQRMKMIDLWDDPIIGLEKSKALREEFNEVTFQQHHRALLFFRSPRKLYGPLTQHIIE